MSGREAAIHNNAVWCDTVCRALGADTAWMDGLWLNRSPAPPYYSNAVTTDGQATDAQLRRLRWMRGTDLPRPWSIKDGFHVLDLAPEGFQVLFEAAWIHLPVEVAIAATEPTDGDRVSTATLEWSPATSVAELVAWETAWRGANPDATASGIPELFQPRLLADPAMRFLAGRRDGRIVAVVAANRSDDGTGPVVGISNIVIGGPAPETLRASVVRAVRDAFPGLPVVGYERGDDLTAMLALGFRRSGALRVWITRD
jgi:hypothetical protein